MKKYKLRILLLLLLTAAYMAINTLSVSAYFYNITYSCNDNVCIEGETAAWYFELLNQGNKEVEYIGIELASITNITPFASLHIQFYPLSSYRGKLITVGTNEKVSINFTAKLPKANFGRRLVYQPCFTTTITDSYIIARDNIYESRQCYNQNETMEVLKCVANAHCGLDEYCILNRCAKLECKSCQYIINHTCANYECCSSEECKADEQCRNNTCQNLNCDIQDYISNHTCRFLSCSFDEYTENRACKKLDCGIYEYAFNHSCTQLNCSENQFVENHTCKMLKCEETEYAKNHACVKLECLYNETFSNHACKPLDCHFFQDKINHSCISNKKVIYKLVLEIIAIIAIILFFAIDYKKYGQKHKESKKE